MQIQPLLPNYNVFIDERIIIADFFDACLVGNLEIVERLFKNNSRLLNTSNPSGFVMACTQSQHEVIKLLLDLKFDVFVQTSERISNFEIWIHYLDKSNSNLDVLFEYLLLMTPENGNIELVLSNVLNKLIDAYDRDFITFEVIKKFLSHSKFVDLCDFERPLHGLSILHAFSIENHDKMVCALSALTKLFKEIPKLSSWNTQEQRDKIHLLQNQPLDEETTKIFEKSEIITHVFPEYLRMKQVYEACSCSSLFDSNMGFPEAVWKYIAKPSTQISDLDIIDRKLLSIKLRMPLNELNDKIQGVEILYYNDVLIHGTIEQYFRNKFEFYVKAGNLEVIKVIVKYLSVPKLKTKLCLSIPTICGEEKILQFLLSLNFNVNLKDDEGISTIAKVMNYLNDNYVKKSDKKIKKILNCFGLLLKKGGNTQTISKNNEEVFEFLIKCSSKIPFIKKFLKKWFNDSTIKISNESLKKMLSMGLKHLNTEQLAEVLVACRKRLTSLKDIFILPSKMWSLDTPVSTIAQFSKLECEFNKELASFIEKQDSLFNCFDNSMRDQMKKVLLLSTLLAAIIRKEEKRESERTYNLFYMILESDLPGIKKEMDFVKEEILTLRFETDLQRNIMLELLSNRSLTIEEKEPLTIKLSGIQNAKLSISQIDSIKKKYKYNLQQRLIAPIAKTDESAPKDKIEKKPIEAEKPPKRSPRRPHPTLSKKEQKTEQVRLNLQRKKEVKAQTKPAPKKPLFTSKPKPISRKIIEQSLPVYPLFGSELDERQVKEQVASKNREDYLAKRKENLSEEATSAKLKPTSLLSFEFRKNQKDRLQVAIDALLALKGKVEKFNLQAITLEGDRFLIATLNKSLSYHLLRFLEALAPTSERLKNDERDAKFFHNLESFFLSSSEIRALRHAIRGSFLKIKITDLHNLIKVFLENDVLQKLDIFLNENKLFTDSKKLTAVNLLKFNFSLEEYLKSLNATEKNQFLKKALRKQIKFTGKCFEAIKKSEDEVLSSTLLDAIKKSLSDISKLAAILPEKTNRALLNTEALKLIRLLGNEVAHDIDLGGSLEKRIDLSDISKLFEAENQTLAILLERLK